MLPEGETLKLLTFSLFYFDIQTHYKVSMQIPQLVKLNYLKYTGLDQAFVEVSCRSEHKLIHV